MAAMSNNDRAELHAELMRGLLPAAGMLKADLRAAVNGLDGYIESAAAAINSAIPQPARGALTTSQKARLLALVVLKRYDKGV